MEDRQPSTFQNTASEHIKWPSFMGSHQSTTYISFWGIPFIHAFLKSCPFLQEREVVLIHICGQNYCQLHCLFCLCMSPSRDVESQPDAVDGLGWMYGGYQTPPWLSLLHPYGREAYGQRRGSRMVSLNLWSVVIWYCMLRCCILFLKKCEGLPFFDGWCILFAKMYGGPPYFLWSQSEFL